MISGNRQKGEFRWVALFGIIVILITSIPYAIGLIHQNDDWVFTGAIINMEDVNSYFANIVSGSAGAWLFQTPYSAVEQPKTLIFLPYLLMGKLLAPPDLHLKTVILFHMFRAVAGFMVIVATYDFLSIFIRQIRWRRWGTVLASVGGGLGWIIPLLGSSNYLDRMPIESYSPEAFGFLMLLCVPHLALARAFLLWGIRSYLSAARMTGKPFILESLKTGVLWLCCALAQPLTGLIAGAIPAAHILVTGVWQWIRSLIKQKAEWREWSRYLFSALIAGIIAGPFAIYNIYSFTQDAYLNQWTAQSYLPSANPLLYILAYLLLIPLAVMGVIQLYKKDSWRGVFLSQWVIVFMCAMYIPFAYQRRLIEGVWVALCALAGIAFEWLAEKPQIKVKVKLGSFGVAALSMITSGLLIAGMIAQVLFLSEPVYIPSEQAQIYETLGEVAKKGDIVLSGSASGNLIPTWAAVRVVIGNTTLTPNYAQVNNEVGKFFSNNFSLGERESMLREWNVRYVIWGAEERKLGSWNPEGSTYLSLISSVGSTQLFECQKNSE